MTPVRTVAVAATALAALVCGCAPPQACTLIGFVPSVAVDLGAVVPDPAAVEATVCLEEECGPADVGVAPDEPATAVRQQDVPDRDEVAVRVTVTDAVTGAELYRGAGRVRTEVLEINGPGCGESLSLPRVSARPDGTLVG